MTAWPRPTDDHAIFESAWTSVARRVHVTELAWLQRMRTATLYRYDLPAAMFAPWNDASGQWISEAFVAPLNVVAMPDLFDAHA